MGINQEAILKQQGHIQSLLKVCFHINPASMGFPPEDTLASHSLPCQATHPHILSNSYNNYILEYLIGDIYKAAI